MIVQPNSELVWFTGLVGPEDITELDVSEGGGFKGVIYEAQLRETALHPRPGKHLLRLGTSIGSSTAIYEGFGRPLDMIALWATVHDSTPWNGIKGWARLDLLAHDHLFDITPAIEHEAVLIADPTKMLNPIGFGVVDQTDGGKHKIGVFYHDSDPATIALWSAGSKHVDGLFSGPREFIDGGHKRDLPLPTPEDLPNVHRLDAKFCNPIFPTEDKHIDLAANRWQRLARVFDTAFAAHVDREIDLLRRWAAHGATGSIRAPKQHHGSLIDTSPETFALRRRLSAEMQAHPIALGAL